MCINYQSDESSYNVKVINDIIYNEKAHIVARFKDFLIYDDCSEFLRRSFKVSESKQRLKKILDFYDNYSKIFANYIILPESKYMYKNIQRKQKMIDGQQKAKSEDKDNKEDKIFNTQIYNSIMNMTQATFEIDTSYLSVENLIDTIAINDKDNNRDRDLKELGEMKDLNLNVINSFVEVNIVDVKNKNSAITNSAQKTKIKTSELKRPGNNSDYTSNYISNTTNLPITTLNTARDTKKSYLSSVANSNTFNPSSSTNVNFKPFTNILNERNSVMSNKDSKNRISSPIDENTTPNKNKKTMTTNITNTIVDTTRNKIVTTNTTHNSTQANNIVTNPSNKTHKGTLSMPKLMTNNIYNNFNIINNYQTAPQTTQINIFNNVDGGMLNNLLTNINLKNNIGIINDLTNSIANMQNSSNNTKLLTTGTLSSKGSPKKSTSKIKVFPNDKEKSASKEKREKLTFNSNKTDGFKYLKSNLDKIKAKPYNTNTYSIVNEIIGKNENQNNKGKLVISTNRESTGSVTSRIVSPTGNKIKTNFQSPKIKEKANPIISPNSNTLRSILHRDLFESENVGLNTERVASKNKIDHTKVKIKI